MMTCESTLKGPPTEVASALWGCPRDRATGGIQFCSGPHIPWRGQRGLQREGGVGISVSFVFWGQSFIRGILKPHKSGGGGGGQSPFAICRTFGGDRP